MRKLALFLLILMASAFAQLATMETLPTPVNYASGTVGSTTAAFQVNVTSGNVIVIIEADEGNASPGSDPTFADSLGTTFTKKATTGNGSGCTGGARIYTGTAPSSGADTLTATAGSSTDMTIQGLEFSSVTATSDGTETSTWTSQTTVTTNAITTAASRDLIVFATKSCISGRQPMFPNTPMEWVTANHGVTNSNMLVAGYYVANASGTETGTFTEQASASGGSTVGIALKSTASLAVATNNLGDAVSGQSYRASLAATGGSGSYTWAITSGALPPGLSLSGNIISGTPTASAGSCCTFQVTDGASNTATKSLSIAVGTAFNTVTLAHQAWPGTSTNAVISGVTSGNLLECDFWIQPFTSPTLTDLLSTKFVPLVGSIPMFTDLSDPGMSHRVYIGFAAGSGNDTISFGATYNGAGCMEFSNVQKIYDTFAQNSTFTASGGGSPITSGTVNLPASDTITCFFMPGTVTTTIGAGAGYTALTGVSGVNADLGGEYKVGASGGNNTCSFTESGNTRGDSALLLYGFRPTKTGTAAAAGVPRHAGTVF